MHKMVRLGISVWEYDVAVCCGKGDAVVCYRSSVLTDVLESEGIQNQVAVLRIQP